MKTRIGIVGAGNVGATCAHISLMKNLGDIYLLDIAADMAKGKAIDLNQSKFLFGSDAAVDGGDDYSKLIDSDIIVITAGLARKPGMTRDDLLFKNFDIIKDVSLKIKQSKRTPIVIVVSNPLDIMAYTVYRITGFPRNRVLGMAGVLDTYRFYHNIQNRLNTPYKYMDSMILGSHGDTMVPLISQTKIAGKFIEKMLPAEEINALADRARNGGAEIVSLLKTGSAYYAPAASVVRMMESILTGRKGTLPCSVYTEGDYGYKDIFLGLPVQLGPNGLAKVVNIKLSEAEKKALDMSAASIAEQIAKIKDRI
ncbi:MAG: malate dehydrogenase [Spirochaetia bacterium]|nr:malate dehydrogenase [Spirochaetia bacterium]